MEEFPKPETRKIGLSEKEEKENKKNRNILSEKNKIYKCNFITNLKL